MVAIGARLSIVKNKGKGNRRDAEDAETDAEKIKNNLSGDGNSTSISR
jgi:hypothetical protein